MRAVWPDLREMILPRRKLLALGFALMVVNRLSGLVLPYSTKFLIDDILGKHHKEMLTPLVRRASFRAALAACSAALVEVRSAPVFLA